MKKIIKPLIASIAVVMFAATFVACSPSPSLNFDDAKSRLEARGYSVTTSNNSDLYEWSLNAIKIDEADGTHIIMILKYKEAERAQLLYEAQELERDYKVDKLELELKELQLKQKYDDLSEKEKEELQDDIYEKESELKKVKEESKLFGKSGKIVWIASDKQAIEDTK